MDFINKIFEFDLATMVPDMAQVLDKVRLAVTAAVLLGPAFLLILGLIYFFIPPKEANHRLGFRTYFGMGSVEAWQFTQKAAGIAFGSLGLILLIVTLVIISGFDTLDHFQMTSKAMSCMLWQAGLALLLRLAVVVLVTVRYNKNGDRRKSNE